MLGQLLFGHHFPIFWGDPVVYVLDWDMDSKLQLFVGS